MAWTGALPFFAENELACKGTGVIKLDMRFAAALPALRAKWDRPMILTSVCRTPEHNERAGGHPRSLHLTENPVHPTEGTMAADVAWRDWPQAEQLQFARVAYRLGWAIGLHNGFCHIDRRGDIGLPKTVFLYGSWDGFDRNEVF